MLRLDDKHQIEEKMAQWLAHPLIAGFGWGLSGRKNAVIKPNAVRSCTSR